MYLCSSFWHVYYRISFVVLETVVIGRYPLCKSCRVMLKRKFMSYLRPFNVDVAFKITIELSNNDLFYIKW
jgi:hypothetical protein